MSTKKRRSAADSRIAILEAAKMSFAQYGFERTTMRAVAAVAQCDPALIIRYFTSKQALFTAAVDLPLERLTPPGDGNAPDLQSLLTKFIETWDSDLTFSGLLRSSATNPEAAATMRHFFEQRVSGLLMQWSHGSEDLAEILAAMLIGLSWGRTIIGLERLKQMSSQDVAQLAMKLLK